MGMFVKYIYKKKVSKMSEIVVVPPRNDVFKPFWTPSLFIIYLFIYYSWFLIYFSTDSCFQAGWLV